METINANVAFVRGAVENLVSCLREVPLFSLLCWELLALGS